MPGFPVHHQLLDLAQTHDHRFGDAIQPFHPLLSPSPAFINLLGFNSIDFENFYLPVIENIDNFYQKLANKYVLI